MAVKWCGCSYFQDGLKTIEHFHCYIEELVVQLARLKQNQDAERRKLVELRDVLRSFMSSYKEVNVSESVVVIIRDVTELAEMHFSQIQILCFKSVRFRCRQICRVFTACSVKLSYNYVEKKSHTTLVFVLVLLIIT